MKRLQKVLQNLNLQKMLFITVLLSGMLLAAPMVAQNNNQGNAQQNNSQTGVAEGILVGKGKGWIAVSVENEETGRAQTVRLSPVWVGGLPKFGGGPDKRMLAIFEQLQKGDNLKFAWLRDGNNLYVTNIQVLPPQNEQDDGQKDDGQKDDGQE